MPTTKPSAMRRLAALLLASGAIAGVSACGSSTKVITQHGTPATTTASTTAQTTASVPTTTVQTKTRTATATTGTSSSTTSTATDTTASDSGSACTAADLKLTYLGGSGATGHGELGFALTNTGSGPCHTYGYPGIQFQTSGGAPLPTNSQRTTSDFFGNLPEKTVTIAPGGQASFRVGVTHVAQGSDSAKGCTTAAQIQVIPPDDTHTLVLALPSGGSYECGTSTVSPVQPGSTAFNG